MKHAVAVVAINQPLLLKVSLPSYEAYCNKVNADLVVIDQPKYFIQSNYKHRQYRLGPYNYIKFEKNQIYELFEKYDRVLRLDVDTVIAPNTPNLFDSNSEYLYAVREDIGKFKTLSLKQISTIKNALGNIDKWNEGYLNGGVVLASKQHKEVFNISDVNFELDLGLLKEQNVFNWKVNNLKIKCKELDKKFNTFGDNSIDSNAFILHFTVQGDELKRNYMKKAMSVFNFEQTYTI